MTFKEKLQEEHPDKIDPIYDGGCAGCPHDYHYASEKDTRKFCPDCDACWNGEIPGIKPAKKVSPTTRKTKAELLDEIKALREEIDNLEKYKQLENAASDAARFVDAFVAAGFTREEAMQVLLTSLKTK